MSINFLNSSELNFSKKITYFLSKRFKFINNEINIKVINILKDIKKNKNQALIKYTNIFDNLNIKNILKLKINYKCIKKSLNKISKKFKVNLFKSIKRIKKYHEYQKKKYFLNNFIYKENNGIIIGQKIIPINRIGVYVPGGNSFYPSSLLMNIIPAQIAGVKEIIIVSPNIKKNFLLLASAYILGIKDIYCIGGAQAIGALTYGTETIKKVDKIIGPGNSYVTSAKKMVFSDVGIDMIAGPSEILIICDGKINSKLPALDLYTQSEHDLISQSILICHNINYINKIYKNLNKYLKNIYKKNIIKSSFNNYCIFIKSKNINDTCNISNFIASEHLEILCKDADKIMNKINHAGSIFLSKFSSESLSDYCAGPNHVLPTLQTSKFFSSLGIYDFFKRSSIIKINKKGFNNIYKIVENISYKEKFISHYKSIHKRIKI